MKLKIRNWGIWVLVLCVLLGLTACTAIAEADDEDSEESLRWLLSEETATDKLALFSYGDYDGDGIHEAFALVGEYEEWGSYSGDLWFVSPLYCQALQTGLSYTDLSTQGDQPPILFTVEEHYGGSGSTSYIWTVVDGAPVQVQDGMSGGFEYGGGNEFYSYPDAFDLFSDGTGHTWKRYYYFLDGVEMREYGGIYITMENLLEFEGASEILANVQSMGYQVTDIIYRGNGIINVNLVQDAGDFALNENLTLRYDDVRVVDLQESYGGIYLPANNPEIAVYPQEFKHPSGAGSQMTSDASSSAAPAEATPPAQDLAGEESVQTPAQTQQALTGVVIATGDVNLRSGPGLDYEKMGILYAGQERAYTGKTSVDERGVEWYSLDFDGKEAWASSKYTYVEIYSDASTYAANDGYSDSYGESNELADTVVSEEIEIPVGTVMTEAQIQACFGVFNFNGTINTTGVESYSENGRQVFKLYFAQDVYHGGTDGYVDRWLSEGGIVAERDADLDGDGTDEHLVFVLSSMIMESYQEPDIYCTVVIFEPVSDGFAFADSFEFNFDWQGEGPRFVRLVDGEKGVYILNCSIAYWDGGNGGVNATLYGYDGKNAYADLIVSSETEDSFYLEKRIDADLVRECRELCEDYEFMYSDAQDMGIYEGGNLHSFNRIDVPLYNYENYENSTLNLTRFGGIEACGAAVKPYGFELGYRLRMRDDGMETYDLFLEGGDEIIWAEEADPDDWEKDFIEMRLNSTLEHVF